MSMNGDERASAPVREDQVSSATDSLSAATLAERRLRQSEASLAAAQRIARLGSWEMDLVDVNDLSKGGLRWSDEVFRICGYAPGELEVTYANFLLAVHPDDRGLIGDAVAAALKESRAYNLTHRIVRPDGSERVVRGQAEFEFDPVAGHPTRMIGTVLDITDQQRAAQVMTRTLDRLHNAQQIGRIGDWEWHAESREILWSPQMFDIVGRAPALGAPRDFASAEQMFDFASLQTLRERVAHILATGEAADFEVTVVKPDGVRVPVQVRAVAVTDLTGRVTGLSGTFQDVATRKSAEAAIERTIRRLTEAQRIGRIGDWEWDLVSGEITWSPEVFDIFGRDPQLGPPPSFEAHLEAYDESSQQVTREKVALALASGKPQEYELVIVRPDGDHANLLARALVRTGDSGDVVGMYGTVQDITERKRGELQALRLASIVESSDDAIIGVTLDGIVTSWNRAAEATYGYLAEEMIGTPVVRLIPAALQDEAAEIFGRVLRGERVAHFETTRVRKDGRLIDVSVMISPIRDAKGVVIGASKVVRDISEQQRIERQFLRAQRMESIGTLAGGIAHDLNNVLTPIMLSVGMLQMTVSDASDRELLDSIHLSAQHGADLVRQVLTFARGVEGKRGEVRVDQLVRDVERTARDTFFKYIDVRTSIAADLWCVVGDQTQLQQVLMNLCVNARDAMPDGGTLTIAAENVTLDAMDAELYLEAVAGPYVLLRVEDSGTGIAAADIERIFDPFFTTKDVGVGTGLGLSTTLAIVKSHDGFIRVTSEPGAGTSFHVYLPAQVDGCSEGHGVARALPRGHDELVLLVDDEPSVRLITQKTLEAFGYRVVVASNGAEAVAIYTDRRDDIALVLTDMMMPVMDGASTIRALRTMKPDVRIVATSGLMNHVTGTGAGLAVTHFLAKPYTADTLLTMIRDCIHDSQ